MDMKTQTKLKSGCDAQQYKFKPRAFKIENIYGIDISNLKNISVNESFSDWKESILEEFSEKVSHSNFFSIASFIVYCYLFPLHFFSHADVYILVFWRK